MSRKKNVAIINIQSEDGLASVVNRYVEIELRIAEAKSVHEQNVARLNAEYDRETKAMVEELDQLIASSQVFCERNRDLFPESAKSRAYRNATVGFRTNPPKVEKALDKDTWEAIAKRIELVPWGETYLHRKDPTVNKDALLTDRANLTSEQLAQIGVRIVQGETFYISPAFEGASAVSKPAEAA